MSVIADGAFGHASRGTHSLRGIKSLPSFMCLQRDKEVQFYIEAPAVTSVGKVAVQAASMHNMFRHIQR